MILCNHEIASAIELGNLIINPPPQSKQFGTTSLDLRVGNDPREWNRELLRTEGVGTHVDLDAVYIADLLPFTKPVEMREDTLEIRPDDFIIIRTLESIELPLEGQLAARVEGRSSAARLGLSVHITAPTIHAGFSGRITLEILNHGPFTVCVHPDVTRLCQLIFERVGAPPSKDPLASFVDQPTPLGTPR